MRGEHETEPSIVGPGRAIARWPIANVYRYFGLLAVLGLMCLLFGLASDRFLTPRTFTSIANQIPELTLVAVGMTLVLVIGGIDLSVGSLLALGSAILGVLMVDHGVAVLGRRPDRDFAVWGRGSGQRRGEYRGGDPFVHRDLGDA